MLSYPYRSKTFASSLCQYTKTMFLSLTLTLGASLSAFSHSTEAYLIADPDNQTVTVWYGGYHSGASNEGYVTITGPQSFTKVVDMLTSTEPTNLSQGTNISATSCGGVGFGGGSGSLDPSVIWQGVTFENVPSGSYSVELAGNFSANWEPCSDEISSPDTFIDVDTGTPIWMNVPSNIILDAAQNETSATASWTPPTVSNNISPATSTHTPGDAFPIGTTVVSYTAAGNNNTSATVSFNVIVRPYTVGDNPVALAGPDSTVDEGVVVTLDGSNSFDPNNLTLTYTWVQLSGQTVALDNDTTATPSFPAPILNLASSIPSESFTYELTVSNGTTTSATSTDTVTITVNNGDFVDPTPPIITAEDITETTAEGEATADVTFAATATDNSGADITPVYKLADGTVITSPYTFDVGVHTVTVEATDAAGNMSTDTFTVTVNDGADTTAPDAPTSSTVINPDGTLTTTGSAEPGSEVTVTWPDGTTSTVMAGDDGSYTATSETDQTRDGGSSADAALPEGTVTVTAMDEAGNVSPETTTPIVLDVTSPSVTISGAPDEVMPGDRFTVSIAFSEAVSGLEASEIVASHARVTDLSGAGSNYTATLTASGEGEVSITVPAAVAVDKAGHDNTASNTLVIENATVRETQEQIVGFMQARADLLLRNQPGLIPFLRDHSDGEVSLNATTAGGQFAFRTGSDKPVWFKLDGSWTNEGETTGNYVFGALGAHTKINENLLIGGMLEFDTLTQETDGSSIKGTGWLVGPYIVAKAPNHPLYLEGRVLYGRTNNEVSPFGTYSDEFETERGLAQVKVSGEVNPSEALSLYPFLDASYLKETQLAYTDSLGNEVSEQEIGLSQIQFGLDFAQDIAVENGAFEINGGLSGIWSSSNGKGGAAANAVPTYEEGRARAELGFIRTLDNNLSFSASTYYDGIGVDDYETMGITIGLQTEF